VFIESELELLGLGKLNIIIRNSEALKAPINAVIGMTGVQATDNGSLTELIYLAAKVGSNFADKWRTLSWHSLLSD
jgi:hypothetical protein